MCHKGQILSSRHREKRNAIFAFVHVCFTRQIWQNVASTDESKCRDYGHRTMIRFDRFYCKIPQNITQDAQFQQLCQWGAQERLNDYTWRTTHVMSIVIFIFTPDCIQHAIVTV